MVPNNVPDMTVCYSKGATPEPLKSVHGSVVFNPTNERQNAIHISKIPHTLNKRSLPRTKSRHLSDHGDCFLELELQSGKTRPHFKPSNERQLGLSTTEVHSHTGASPHYGVYTLQATLIPEMRWKEASVTKRHARQCSVDWYPAYRPMPPL